MTAKSEAEVVLALTAVLDRTVRALGDAGEPISASRLAAEAWSTLRVDFPDQAERLNRALHYLARREAELSPKSP